MRRSTRNQSAVAAKEANKKIGNEVVDVKRPKKLAATDSFVKIKGEEETENEPATTTGRDAVRKSNRNTERASDSLKVSNASSRRSHTPTAQSTPRKSVKAAAQENIELPAKKTNEEENVSSSSSSSSSEDEIQRASDYSKSDSGEEEEMEADKSEEEDAHDGNIDEVSSDDDTDTRKRRRGGVNATPRKNKSRIVGHFTPSKKRNLQQRRAANAVKPLPAPAIESLNDTTDRDAKSLSRALLHVGATPGYLPCREDEYLMIEGCIEGLLEDGQGGCVYISGTPGTGKTATVHSVIRALIERSNNQEIAPFKYVEINGLRVSEPARAYPILWEGLTGDAMNLSPRAALNALEKYYGDGRNDQACVLLMDELDQMVTSKQSEVYNFFNWPNMPRSKLIVVAVANTMDLPERVLRGKVKSRLGMERINFAPYDRTQLIEIVQSRLRYAVSLAEKRDYTHLTDDDTQGIFDQDAVKIAAAKTASVQGDARRMLEVCRQTLERTEILPVKTSHVQQTLKAMSLSPLSRMMAGLSLSAKIMLVSTMRCAAAAGLGTGECRWGDVSSLHQKLSNQIISYTPPIPLSRTDQYAILSALAATRIVLAHEPGAGYTGLSKGSDAERMLILNVPEADMGDFHKIHRHFSPLLSIHTDPTVNDLLQRTNSISNLSDLLRPFDVLHNVPLRTSQLETHHAPTFYLRFSELAQLDAPTEELHRVVDDAASAATGGEKEREDEILNTGEQYNKFVDSLLSHHHLLPYSTFQHPAAFILATTTTHSDPIAELARLAKEVALPDAYAKRTYMNATPSYVLRYHVLVHDAHNGDMDSARMLLEQAKKIHGIHCALLIINSKESGGDEQSHHAESNEQLQVVTRTYGHSRGHSLDTSDLTVVRAFVRELVVQSLIPWMEKCTRDWNQLFVTNRKGFTNKLFSSFGVSKKWTAQQTPTRAVGSAATTGSFLSSEKIYPSTTHEATFRRLADFAFMLRDYKLSAQVYSQLRRDVAEEPEAYHYAASANEMLGLSHLLSPHSPTSTLDATVQYLDEASAVWSGTRDVNDHAQAVRATVLFVESFRARGSSGLVIPSAFIRAATGTSVYHALLLHQAAIAYETHVRPYKRKASLYYVRAASVYEANGKLELARLCYSHCDTTRFPFVVEALGRLASGVDNQKAANLLTQSLRYAGDQTLLDNWRHSISQEGVSIDSLTFPLPLFDKTATTIVDPHKHSYTNRRSEGIFDSMEAAIGVDGERGVKCVDVDVNEVFEVQLLSRNPFNAGVTLSEFELSFDGDAEVSVERLDDTVELGAMQSLPVTFKCSVASLSKISLQSVSFKMDGLAKFTESLHRNGPRLNDTKEQRIGKFYAPDLSLQVRVNEPSPRLSASVEDFPQRLGLGEGRLSHIKLNNVGLVDIEDVQVCVNEQSFMLVGVDETIRSARDIYKQSHSDSLQKTQIENNLLPHQPYTTTQPLKSADSTAIPVLIRGDNVGKRLLHLIVAYKEKKSAARNVFRVKRLLHVLDIRPVVDVKLAAQPSKTTLGSYDLSLEIENVVPESQVDITQVSFVSPAWKCVGELQSMSLGFEEIGKQSFSVRFDEAYDVKSGHAMQEYVVKQMATYLQGKDVSGSLPPSANVLASHLTSTAYTDVTQTNLLTIMMNARRNLRYLTLQHELKSIDRDVLAHIFPLMEAGEGDVVVCWKLGDRVGHALVSGLVMGAREGLSRRIGERVKESKDAKSVLYASTIKERENTTSELLRSRFSINDMPIIVNTYTPSTINHLFDQEPILNLSVDVSLFNNSISKDIECGLLLKDRIEGIDAPTRQFSATVKPQSSHVVSIPLTCSHPGAYKFSELVLSLGGSRYIVNLNEIVVV
ncbi:hypothetical protein E3P99_00080 [Wallemia hederae]|uniref:AAA+ ATPase domain-containing protein n=1 Tax=Wallemia hederae TaxID=1540922 RepID=A0A4T0FXC7_9BASI|nr:hypothetical protein E3P99_00080 [Wallemia hederae]